MRTNSKSTKEIFADKYPQEMLKGNAFKCCEAVGWLKCQAMHIPSIADWAEIEIGKLVIMATIALKEA